IFLVILFSNVELDRRDALGDDRRREGLVRRKFRDDFLGFGFFLRRMIENGRAVLRADVVTLTVQSGRIVDDEKYLQKIAETQSRRNKSNLYDLGITVVAATYIAVGRFWLVAAHLPRFNADDTFEPVVHGLEAPETASR